MIPDLGEDLIFCLCLGLKSRALVLNAMAENLDALNEWWLGVFIAPTHQNGRWGTLLSTGAPDSPVRHRTLSGAPATSPNRWVRPLEFLTTGPPDSPVVHRIGTVHCPVRLLAPALTLRELSAHCSGVSQPLNSTIAPATVAPLAHRTVR